jgi:hypothetical protein
MKNKTPNNPNIKLKVTTPKTNNYIVSENIDNFESKDKKYNIVQYDVKIDLLFRKSGNAEDSE